MYIEGGNVAASHHQLDQLGRPVVGVRFLGFPEQRRVALSSASHRYWVSTVGDVFGLVGFFSAI